MSKGFREDLLRVLHDFGHTDPQIHADIIKYASAEEKLRLTVRIKTYCDTVKIPISKLRDVRKFIDGTLWLLEHKEEMNGEKEITKSPAKVSTDVDKLDLQDVKDVNDLLQRCRRARQI